MPPHLDGAVVRAQVRFHRIVLLEKSQCAVFVLAIIVVGDDLEERRGIEEEQEEEVQMSRKWTVDCCQIPPSCRSTDRLLFSHPGFSLVGIGQKLLCAVALLQI